MAGTLSWQQIYGAQSGNAVTPPSSQGQGGTATAATSGGNNGGSTAGSLGWWLALVAGLVVIRVVYEVKGRFD
jgi:hypothetical protein